MNTIYEMLKERKMLASDDEPRPVKYKKTDIAALKAIIQAAINVENFTIPLYMCSMYSIKGMHPITGNNDLYLGRLWPGMATSAKPDTANEITFNQIFKVFIEEMLHLQMIANIATVCGIKKPCFTSPELMDQDTYGWTCYGDHQTVIPHIIDLRDMYSNQTDYSKIRVKLDSLNEQQIELFIAIEASGTTTEKNLKPDACDKYFPKAPFDNWEASDSLPMFGSIGWLYVCLWKYIETRYEDGSSLWGAVYQCNALQRDLFNNDPSESGKTGKPKEYPHMRAKIKDFGKEASTPSLEEAKDNLLDMISGITDQGEGQTVIDIIEEHLRSQPKAMKPGEVKPNYQADYDSLTKRYPSYNDRGERTLPSADAEARASKPTVSMDHLEIFTAIKAHLSDTETNDPIITWDKWHAAQKQEDPWTGAMLQTDDGAYNGNRFKDTLPSPDEVAGALNRLKADTDNNSYHVMSQAATGAIKGITTVLDEYWHNPKISFPFPSMGGSGDRMAICWAVFGKAPNLRRGTPAKRRSRLYHACQGLKLDSRLPNQPGGCGLVEVYHTCRGSNTCKGESGCGFVQPVGGGGNCSHPKTGVHLQSAVPQDNTSESVCDDSIYYSTPSANKCAGQGGCAIPISASQLHMESTDKQTMSVFNIQLDDGHDELLGHFVYDENPNRDNPDPDKPYYEGALVHDVAWAGYVKILEANGEKAPEKPKPSDLRLAFPPST